MPEVRAENARLLVRRLIDTGERLPKELRSDILHLGDAGVMALLEILEDEALAQIDSPGEGWAPIHAAALLGNLRAATAVEPMLRALARTGPLDILHDRVVSSLPRIGAPVVEPALRTAASAEDEVRDSVASVLARVGLRDDRILDVLLAQLRRAPGFAGNLAEYGDPRALPSLIEALDAFELNESGNPFANHALIEIRCAIEELGGTLTAEQQLKCRRGQAAAESVRQRLRERLEAPADASPPVAPARRHDRPGRNDPCWCGSGKKYKRCHIDADADDASAGKTFR
jgi:SEC-C motif